ncbi:MAG TPA: hypothetical protein VK483_05840 [Chitinophagaceae bacterium]|nr:hypothetical protein [Chitinophagaceae bacterium]
MKYLTYLAVSSFMFTCLSCGNGKSADESETKVTSFPVIPANTTTQPQTIPVNLNSQTTPSTTVTPTNTTPTVTPTNTTVAAGMNPPHGQPGHRCDIAVGAPLNSAPATTATTPVPTPINISSDKLTQPATTAVAPGMNPAHGQPGHRCDIAVGAPLNSKPASNAATPVNISSDQVTQPATTAVGPGMNPQHGQPGHRCDIPVGAPLSTPMAPNYAPPTDNKEILPKVVPIKPLADSTGKNR